MDEKALSGHESVGIMPQAVTACAVSGEAIDAFLEAFIKEAMEANGLGYVGGDDYGLVCLQKRGSVSEEQRAAVDAWLKTRSELTKAEVSPLLDVWYPEKPINAAK
ncbi:MAG: hypothetical protein K0S85_4091 [Pseudomonas orientalis]|nr:hypothetical protein [Pseudomonas orientalis]